MSCDKCACTCPLEVGDKVRHTKTFGDLGHSEIRLGGAEPKFLTYLSKDWAGFSVYSSDGDFLTEKMLPRVVFDSTMERDTQQ